MTLEQARERARELRMQVIGGLDPVAERRAARAATLAALGRRKNYREVANRVPPVAGTKLPEPQARRPMDGHPRDLRLPGVR